MKPLSPDETVIEGHWVYGDGPPRADENCRRIEWLLECCLERLAMDSSGWETLYRDQNDRRLWELTYLQSWMHGGGPPTLRLLTTDQAREKYGEDPLT